MKSEVSSASKENILHGILFPEIDCAVTHPKPCTHYLSEHKNHTIRTHIIQDINLENKIKPS